VHAVVSSSKEIQIAPLGLIEKMSGAAAMLGHEVTVSSTGRINIDIRLKALGVLGVYISSFESKLVRDGCLVTLQGAVVPVHTVRVGGGGGGGKVMEIDLQAAWDEMGLQPLWGDEVNVKVVLVPVVRCATVG